MSERGVTEMGDRKEERESRYRRGNRRRVRSKTEEKEGYILGIGLDR